MKNVIINFGDIIQLENELAAKAKDKYGEFYENALEFSLLLQEFILSMSENNYIFFAFLTQLRKHHTLAILSAVRLHQTQAFINLRYVLEAGVCAAYALENPDLNNFTDISKSGLFAEPKRLSKMRYTWVASNYSSASKIIKNIKDTINENSAHANFITAFNTFSSEHVTQTYNSHFFDREEHNQFLTKTTLWMTGDIACVLMDLFFRVNEKSGGIVFCETFLYRMHQNLEQQNALNKKLRELDRKLNLKKE